MNRATFLLVATAAFSTAAGAQPVWDKVELGMSRSQVEAAYPASRTVKYQAAAIEINDVQITAKCAAEVNVRFNAAGNVREVMVAGNPSMGGRCSNDVLTALSGKYGQPANWDDSQGSILAREGRVAVWQRPDGVTMRFKKFTNNGLGGGGMFKASWELSYVAADAISL